MRIGAGVGAWLAPGLSTRVAFRGAQDSAAVPLLLRLFGARDIAMGAGYLSADAREQDRWLKIGIAVDAADAVAALLAGRSGRLQKSAAAPIVLTAVAAVAAASWALSDRDA
jgi:hypothetical protein